MPDDHTNPLTPELVSAILRDPDSPLYPAQIGVFCDNCGVTVEADYLVSDDIDQAARFEVARAHLRTLGWECDETADVCTDCAGEHPVMPARIQRQRTKGKPGIPPGAKYVGRGKGCHWGNPFVVGEDADDREHATALFREWLEHDSATVLDPYGSTEYRQQMSDQREWMLANLPKLRGRDLACWCAVPEPGQPDHCHGAVLLALANPTAPGSTT